MVKGEPLDAEFRTVLHVLRLGFELRRPTAREDANRLRRQYAELLRKLQRGAPSSTERAVFAEFGMTPAPPEITGEIRQAVDMLALRIRAIEELLAKHRKVQLRNHDAGPTAETVSQQEREIGERDAAAGREGLPRGRGDSLARLRANGIIDRVQEGAGRQIATIFEAVTAGLFAKASGFERGSHGGQEDRMSVRLAILHRDRYRPWAERAPKMLGHLALPLVVDVAVDGRSLRAAAGAQSIGYERAKDIVMLTLSLYVQIAARTRHLDDLETVRELAGDEARAIEAPLAATSLPLRTQGAPASSKQR